MRRFCLSLSLAALLCGCTAFSEPWIGPPQCHGTQHLRHWPKKLVAILKLQPNADAYEMDHVIPLCLGGKDELDNLQFQPWSEAREKDHDEWYYCNAVCNGMMLQGYAIMALQRKWPQK